MSDQPYITWDTCQLAMDRAKELVTETPWKCRLCDDLLGHDELRKHLDEFHPGVSAIATPDMCGIFKPYDEDDAFSDVCQDSDQYEWWWEDVINDLQEVMDEMNPNGHWHAQGLKIGWRNLNGHKGFTATDAQKFLQAFLPDCEYTFSMYREDGQLRFRVSHHDSPTGESYIIRPTACCVVCGAYADPKDLTEEVCPDCLED